MHSTPIHVTPAGRASVDPVAAYRAAVAEKAKEAVKEEWRRQADISLAIPAAAGTPDATPWR